MSISNKNLSLLITLLFITSQVFAISSKKCDMDMPKNEVSMAQMDHSNHSMEIKHSDNSSEINNMSDCCDTSCECSMNHCSSHLILSTLQNNISYQASSASLKYQDSFSSSIEYSSLYRPPISS